MIKYFTIEDLLKHYLQKKFHILSKGVSILSARLFTVKTSQGVKHAEKHRYMSDAFYRS